MSYYPSSKIWESTADVTITNTTTETSMVGTGSGYGLTMQPADLNVGTSLDILCRGVYSSAAVPGSLTVKVKLGSTVIATITINNLVSTATNNGFEGRASLVVRANGASGSVVPNGLITYDVLAVAWADSRLDNSGSAVSVDLSANRLLDVTATWATASASNILKVNQMRVIKL